MNFPAAFSFVQKVPPQNKAEKRQQKSQKKSQKTSNQMTLKSNKTPEIIKKVEIKLNEMENIKSMLATKASCIGISIWVWHI